MRIDLSMVEIKRAGIWLRLAEKETDRTILEFPCDFSDRQIWFAVALANGFYTAGRLDMMQDMEIEAQHDNAIRNDLPKK